MYLFTFSNKDVDALKDAATQKREALKNHDISDNTPTSCGASTVGKSSSMATLSLQNKKRSIFSDNNVSMNRNLNEETFAYSTSKQQEDRPSFDKNHSPHKI